MAEAPKICGHKSTWPCNNLMELQQCVEGGKVIPGWLGVRKFGWIVTDEESNTERPYIGPALRPYPEDVRKPTADDLAFAHEWLGTLRESGVGEELSAGEPKYNMFCRSNFAKDPENPGKFSFDIFVAKDYLRKELNLLTNNPYRASDRMINTGKSFELSYDEGMGLIKALDLTSHDFVCEEADSCVKLGEGGSEKPGEDSKPGKFFFTGEKERVETMLSKLGVGSFLQKAWNWLVGSSPASVEVEGMSRERLGEFIGFLESRPFEEELPPIYYISAAGGILAAGAIVYSVVSQRKNNAAIDGRDVTVENLSVDRTKEMRKQFAEGKGEFKTPYRDMGQLDRVFDVFRNTNPKYNNYALIGWTDAGKSFFVEEGLGQAIAVEEYLLDQPEAKAQEIEAKGYPRVPAQHRKWLQDLITKGRKEGQPGFAVVTIDMGDLVKLGAAWKGKEDVMISKVVDFAKKRSKLGLFTNIHIDESKRASAEHHSIDNALLDVSIIEKFKKVCEIPFVSVSQSTTPGEYADMTKDSANTTRYQPVLAPEATPVEIMERMKGNKAYARDFGVKSFSGEALKAVVVLSRELKPTTTYNASSVTLMNDLVSYAGFKKESEITFDLFKEFYKEKFAPTRGELLLTPESLDAHVAKISSVIEGRNAEVLEILNELNRGGHSQEMLLRLDSLKSVRYVPQKGLFSPKILHDDAAKVTRAETVADLLVEGAKQTMLPGAEAESAGAETAKRSGDVAKTNRMIANLTKPARLELLKRISEKWSAFTVEEKTELAKNRQMISVGKHYMPSSWVAEEVKDFVVEAIANRPVKGEILVRQSSKRVGERRVKRNTRQVPMKKGGVKPAGPSKGKALPPGNPMKMLEHKPKK